MTAPRSTLSLLTLSLVLVFAVLQTACDDDVPPAAGPEAGCNDNDGDGYGLGCSAGDDCNDFNPSVQVCDCSQDNFAGCECVPGTQPESCFSGLPQTEGVGSCRGGVRTCDNGAWSACVGEIAPRTELCDDSDNDCDGQVDEQLVLNACGTCDPLCEVDSVGSDPPTEIADTPITMWGLNEDNAVGLVENPQGHIELAQQNSSYPYIWIANSEEGTISKIETETGTEVGRFVTALRVSEGMPPSLATCAFPRDGGDTGNCPSRTAVDLRGDVWVANRAFSGQASVTKIANLSSDCLDKNGDGKISTSSDANGNGVIDLNAPDEFLGEADECVLFSVPLGGNTPNDNALLRALAVDPFTPERGYGSVWAGAYNLRKYYQLSGRDGTLLREVDVPHRPYGAVMDRFGVLYSTSFTLLDGERPTLVPIVSETGQVRPSINVRTEAGCNGGPYGIAIDGVDNIWLGSWDCGAVRYTPSSDSWFTVNLGLGPNTVVRGIAADKDGWIYAGGHINGQGGTEVQWDEGVVARFRQEDGGQMQTYNLGATGSDGTIGVGIDFQGNVWGINNTTSSAARINPTTGDIDVFESTGLRPYTYSDFSGYQLRTFTASQGTYRRVFSGCGESRTVLWDRLIWNADTPPGTEVLLRVRTASTIPDLVTAEDFGPFDTSPVDLGAAGVPDGKFLQVEFQLTTDTPGITPVLKGFDIVRTCPPIQ